MKLPLLLAIGLFSYSTGMAQGPRQINEQDLARMKLKIHKAADEQLKKWMAKSEKDKDFEFKDLLEFKTDTTKIEQFMKQRLAIDYSTAGMVEASYDAEREYDVLLNKYYQQLLKTLEAKDKPLLVEVQKNWLKYRDSERKMNGLLTEDKYSGGGTMQRIIYASAYLELTKKRVLELRDYLSRI